MTKTYSATGRAAYLFDVMGIYDLVSTIAQSAVRWRHSTIKQNVDRSPALQLAK